MRVLHRGAFNGQTLASCVKCRAQVELEPGDVADINVERTAPDRGRADPDPHWTCPECHFFNRWEGAIIGLQESSVAISEFAGVFMDRMDAHYRSSPHAEAMRKAKGGAAKNMFSQLHSAWCESGNAARALFVELWGQYLMPPPTIIEREKEPEPPSEEPKKKLMKKKKKKPVVKLSSPKKEEKEENEQGG